MPILESILSYRYEPDNSISCKLCKEKIASESLWTEHIASEKHKRVGYTSLALLLEDDSTVKRESEKELNPEKVADSRLFDIAREKEQKEVAKEPEIELPPAIEVKPISEILPADFFDDKVQGAVAMGKKAKDAQKELKRFAIRVWVKCRKEEKQIKDLEKEKAESRHNHGHLI